MIQPEATLITSATLSILTPVLAKTGTLPSIVSTTGVRKSEASAGCR